MSGACDASDIKPVCFSPATAPWKRMLQNGHDDADDLSEDVSGYWERSYSAERAETAKRFCFAAKRT